MISIVIPLYNKEKQITNTLCTVLQQTYQKFEVVIVNDGSTDHSVEEVRKIQDERIRIIHQTNMGVAAARNMGIREAKYDLIAFLDADDEWKPTYLETLYQLSQKFSECGVWACRYELREPNGRQKLPVIRKLSFKEVGVLDSFQVANCSNPPLSSISTMIRKQALQELGGFPVGVKSGEDLLTWARLACKMKIAYTTEVLATYCLGLSIPRPPESKDIVGKELELLYIQNGRLKELGLYVAYWYKMRMCRCLSHQMYMKALIAFVKSMKYNPCQLKIYASVLYYLFK